MALPTNYKDDVLGDSMDGKRRYRVIENSDGTISLEDVTEYSQTGSDFGAFDINQINEEVNKMLPKTGEASNTTAVFQDASSRGNLASGEKLSVLFGKISKWLKDLKTVCFTGSYNDLSNRPNLHAVATSGNYNQLNNRPAIGAAASRSVVNNATTTSDGTVLDGRMGKTLNDSINNAKNRIGKLEGYRSWKKIGYNTSGNVSIKGVDASEFLVFVKFSATKDTEGIITINIPAIAPTGYYFDGYDYAGKYTCSACVHYTQGLTIKLLQSWCATTAPTGEGFTQNWRFEVYAR